MSSIGSCVCVGALTIATIALTAMFSSSSEEAAELLLAGVHGDRSNKTDDSQARR